MDDAENQLMLTTTYEEALVLAADLHHPRSIYNLLNS